MIVLANSALESPVTSFWAALISITAFVLILANAYNGWKEGLYRKAAVIVAICISAVFAWLIGPVLGAFLKIHYSYPQLLLNAVGTSVCGISAWIILCFLIKLFVNKTKYYEGEDSYYTIGLSGMLVGALLGFIYAGIIFVFIKLFGTLCEQELEQLNNSEDNKSPQKSSMLILANLKRGIPESFVSPAVDLLDPLPPKVYRIIQKVELIIQNDEALKHLKAQPASQKFMKHPDIIKITEDQELLDLAQEKNFLKFIQNNKIITAADNKELLKIFKNYDIEAAMDEALNHSEGVK